MGQSTLSNLPWIGPLVNDLQQHRGASIVVAGENQPPIIHALAHAMNNALGNVGKTVFYTDPIEVNPVDQRKSLEELLKDLDAGYVDLLVIIGGNPVHNTPVDLKLSPERMNKDDHVLQLRCVLRLLSSASARCSLATSSAFVPP